MARVNRDARLETRDARARLKPAHEPYWRSIHPGLAVGYRKGARGGVWLVRQLIGKKYLKRSLGIADDHADADGNEVLSYKHAHKVALAFSEHDHQAASVSHNPSVKEVVADYLGSHRARGKSHRETENVINSHILPELGERRVSSLTTTDLRRWHEGLATKAPTKRGKVQPFDPNDPEQMRRRKATANRVLTVLKAALNHAWSEGHVDNADAWRRVKPFKGVDVPKVRFLTHEQARALLAACEPDFRDLVRAALTTGARYGELMRLRVEDYHAESGTVLIAESKSGKARHVPLTDEGKGLFARLAKDRTGKALLLTRADGEPWGTSQQIRRTLDACRAAKIDPPISFHDLRHTYASFLASRGVPLQVIAAALGHADTRMTSRHYAHLCPNYVADTIRAHLPDFGKASKGKARGKGKVVSLRERGHQA